MTKTSRGEHQGTSGIRIMLLMIPLLTLLLMKLDAQVVRHVETKDRFAAGSFADWESPDPIFVTRVVDAESRLPIPGAVVSLVVEGDFPLSGRFRSLRQAVADEDGWVRIREKGDPEEKKRRWHWMYCDAPGYAARAEMGGGFEFPLELYRGRDATFRVVDRRGMPISSVDIGLIIGCGHTPDVRQARSNGDGIAIMRDVSTADGIMDLWPRHPRFLARYHDLEDALPSQGWGQIELEYGQGVSGTVVDTAGRPIEGAIIGAPTCHRGPWVLSDASGNFVLPGLDPDDAQIYVIPSGAAEAQAFREEAEVSFPPPGVPLRITLDEEGRVVSETPKRPLKLRFRGTETGAEDLDIALSRSEDGFTLNGNTDSEGAIEFTLPEKGTWTAHVRETQYRWQTSDRRLTEAEIGTGDVTITLQPNPRRRVVLEALDAGGLSAASLVTATGEVSFYDQLEEIEAPDLAKLEPQLRRYVVDLSYPEGRPATLRLAWQDPLGPPGEHGEHVQYVALPKVPSNLTIRQPITRLRIASTRGPDGKPAPAWVFLSDDSRTDLADYPEEDHGDDSPGTSFEFLMSDSKNRWLHMIPENPTLEARCIPLRLHPARKGLIELEVVEFKSRRDAKIRAVGPNGKAAASATLRLRNWRYRGDATLQFDAAGIIESRHLRATQLTGLKVVLENPREDEGPVATVSLSATLEGPGPWNLAWPQRSVILRMPKPTEFTSSVTVFVGEESFSFSEYGDSIRLDGLASGRHRIIVARDEFLAHDITFDLGNDGLEIPIRWTKRP